MFSQRRSRVALSLVCILAFTLVPVSSALGSYIPPINWQAISNPYPSEGDVPVVTVTNPGHRADSDVWWRDGWGNSLVADWRSIVPSGCVEEFFTSRTFDPDTGIPYEPVVLGALYEVDRLQNNDLNPFAPALYNHATGVWDGNRLVIQADMLAESVGQALPPNARHVYEGRWYLHYNFYSESTVSTRTLDIDFGIDVTPPAPVRKVTARPYQSYGGELGKWFETSQSFVSWEDMEYDALSGTAYYEVVVNGEPVDERVWHLGHTLTSISLEDLPGGKNEIQIIPVDRATNRGPAEIVYFYSDADIPEIDITSPASKNANMPAMATFSADASDSAGIQYVDFKIDGKSVYTDKTEPYAFTKDMSSYSFGTHTLTATVKDMYGHTATDSETFNLDPSVPKVTSISDSPDPFYPVIQDGYGDTMSVQFYASEGGKAALYIYDDTGEHYATRSKPSIGSGWQSITWDGLGKDGFVSTGTFSYKVKVVDAAGNTGWSGVGYTTIRDYEIIRISPNAVKIVPR